MPQAARQHQESQLPVIPLVSHSYDSLYAFSHVSQHLRHPQSTLASIIPLFYVFSPHVFSVSSLYTPLLFHLLWAPFSNFEIQGVVFWSVDRYGETERMWTEEVFHLRVSLGHHGQQKTVLGSLWLHSRGNRHYRTFWGIWVMEFWECTEIEKEILDETIVGERS